MKRTLIILFFLYAFLPKGYAQNRPVESARVAFLSQRINITPVQAERFWPVYNEFSRQRFEIRSTIRKIYANMSQGSEQSLYNMERTIDQLTALKQREINLERDYYNRYLLIITPKQLSDLIVAEREFQKILIKKVTED